MRRVRIFYANMKREWFFVIALYRQISVNKIFSLKLFAAMLSHNQVDFYSKLCKTSMAARNRSPSLKIRIDPYQLSELAHGVTPP